MDSLRELETSLEGQKHEADTHKIHCQH